MTAGRTARVVVALVDDDTGKQILLPIGRVDIPEDRPPLMSDVVAVMRAAIERVEVGRHTREQFEQIVAQYGDTP
ncbi:MAG TPA: hypothetical protein VKA83_22250 [Methylomirabilota bacterium]|nr:hypothetical protein [Methylomirabilota bacterium]